jgi:hypothetical protein
MMPPPAPLPPVLLQDEYPENTDEGRYDWQKCKEKQRSELLETRRRTGWQFLVQFSCQNEGLLDILCRKIWLLQQDSRTTTTAYTTFTFTSHK